MFSFTIILHYFIDLILILFFQSRALIPEIFIYLRQAISYDFFIYGIVFSCLYILFFIISFLIAQKIIIKKYTLLICSIAILTGFFGSFTLFHSSISFLGNVLTLNPFFRYANGGYIIPKCKTNYKDHLEVFQGEGKNVNIILVFAESLSAIDSANAGGYNNMPLFDKIQTDGITFTNFIANGMASNTAHIGTFYGLLPGRSSDYSGYNPIMTPLATFLNNYGYTTTFVSTVSLDFLNERAFLQNVGFNNIIGEEAFLGKELYTFDAAPDEYLYDKVLETIDMQKGKYFIGLQTISFHRPYNTPYGNTQELAIRYSDEQLFNFYNKLKERGFFESGILIIVGDHRMMSPIKEGELEMLGENRFSRVAATVIGTGITSGIFNDNLIQHTDIYNSIKLLVGSGNIYADKYYNSIFNNNFNRDWSISVNGLSIYGMNQYNIFFKNNDFYNVNTRNLKTINNDIIYEYICSSLDSQPSDKIKIWD